MFTHIINTINQHKLAHLTNINVTDEMLTISGNNYSMTGICRVKEFVELARALKQFEDKFEITCDLEKDIIIKPLS